MILAFSPDQYVAFWTAVGALAAVVAGGVAVVTLLALKQDSRDRTRPVMSADIVPIVLSRGTSELVIRNSGMSVARNLKVKFDPPIAESGAADHMGPYIGRRYSQVIRTVPPGREFRNVYVHMQNGQPIEPLPMDLTVTMTYEDSRGRSYEDAYDLSVSYIMNQTESWPSNPDARGRQRRFLAAIEAIARGVNR